MSLGAARLGPPQRADHFRRLSSERSDAVVIGGASPAWAPRWTWSQTIHGGLRYLEQRDFALVREAAHERNLSVSLLCPHLTRPTRRQHGGALRRGARHRRAGRRRTHRLGSPRSGSTTCSAATER